MGRRLGVTRSDWLLQHLGAMGLKCVVTGGGATGRMHSKPQGFSTQLITQPVTSMLVISVPSKQYIEYKEGTQAHYPRRAPNCKGRGRHVVSGRAGVIPEGLSEYMTGGNEHIALGVGVYEPVDQGYYEST